MTTSAASSTGSSTTSAHRTSGWLPWAALGVVYLVWGSTCLGIRFTITSMPPLLSAGLRFLVAGLLLMVIVLAVSGRSALRMTASQLGAAALGGVLLPALGNGIVVVAQFQVSSGLAALLVACVPLYVVVLRRISGERPPWITFAGIALGLAGLAVLLLGGATSAGTHGSEWWGPWLVLLAAMFWAIGSFAMTRLSVPANPFVLSAVQMVVGGVVLGVAGVVAGERFDLIQLVGGTLVLVAVVLVVRAERRAVSARSSSADGNVGG